MVKIATIISHPTAIIACLLLFLHSKASAFAPHPEKKRINNRANVLRSTRISSSSSGGEEKMSDLKRILVTGKCSCPAFIYFHMSPLPLLGDYYGGS